MQSTGTSVQQDYTLTLTILLILSNVHYVCLHFFIEGSTLRAVKTKLCCSESLGIPTIREKIKNSSKKYKDRLQTHPNDLATNLFDDEVEVRRLKKFKPSDLSTRLVSIILLNFN
jgi:hypothetical protein